MQASRECDRCGCIYLGDVCPGCPAPSSPPSAFAPGVLFLGFEILEQIGQGGMGVVYKARQRSLDRILALKILQVGKERSQEFRLRFEREAKILAALCHPRIVTVFEYGQEEDIFYFTMEYVEGITLRERLQQSRLSIDEAIRITEQVCEGLSFAHERGVVHRDIKPANLLLDPRGQVKIADFGVAKLMAKDAPALTASGAAVGTFLYMAPEQSTNPGHVDPRVDVFSLGATLYEMLTGRPPGGRFESPSKLGVGNELLDGAVLKAMEHDPAKRYATAAEMAEALRPFRSAFAEKTEIRPAEKPSRRGLFTLAAVAAVTLVATLTVVLWPKRPPAPPAETPGVAPLRASYTLRHELPLPGNPQIRSIVFAPAGDILYVETNLRIQRIDAERGSLMTDWNVSGAPLSRIVASPDGKLLGGTGGGDVQLLRADDGQRTQVLDPQIGKVREFAFSPDGRRIAIAGVVGTCVLDIESRKDVRQITGDAVAVAYHPSGTMLAIATKDRKIKLCDPEKGIVVHSIEAHADLIEDLAFRPDGAVLASCSSDGSIRLWDMNAGKAARTLQVGERVHGVAFRPDSLLLGWTAGAVALWDSDRGERVEIYKGDSRCVAVSRDGKRIAAGDGRGQVCLWERKE